jgi:glycosyltransferase involved in cell wall biosynthesis
MSAPLTVLCAAKLHKNQLERHLELFEHVPEVGRVIVVRHAQAGEHLSKVECRSFRSGALPMNALRMATTIRAIVVEQKVDLVVGFNPVPWGSIAMASARSCGVPTCISLIGRDFLQVQKWWGRPYLEAVRRADAVTVTGQRMVDGLIECGVDAARIQVLPHSVDTERFSPGDSARVYDILSVGQLIERKRMDVLIDGVALLARGGRRLRLGILGDGPLKNQLLEQARDLGITDLVHFLDYRDDVETILRQAAVFCLGSKWEGLPFAMMEAMAAGLVPVMTDVGTISDWVRDGENGCLLPVGDPQGLASRMELLFQNEEAELKRLRATLIAERSRLSFRSGAEVWRKILTAARTTALSPS